MKHLLTVATVALSLVGGAAMADTRFDYMSNSNAYGVIYTNKALPSGRLINYEIPVHTTLLGKHGVATEIGSVGRVLATPVGYVAAAPQTFIATNSYIAAAPIAYYSNTVRTLATPIGYATNIVSAPTYGYYAAPIAYSVATPVMGSRVSVLGLAATPY